MVNDQVQSIATASEQQSAVSEEINRSVEQVATISAETAQAMEQASSAVAELCAAVPNIAETYCRDEERITLSIPVLFCQGRSEMGGPFICCC